jgi:hypothetical protein
MPFLVDPGRETRRIRCSCTKLTIFSPADCCIIQTHEAEDDRWWFDPHGVRTAYALVRVSSTCASGLKNCGDPDDSAFVEYGCNTGNMQVLSTIADDPKGMLDLVS